MGAMLAAAFGAMCGRRGTDDSVVAAGLEDEAEQYVRLTLQLARHQPSLVETWSGPREWTSGPREPVAPVRDSIERLHTRLTGIPTTIAEPARLRYLLGQVSALKVAARRLSGEAMTFADEARQALGLDSATWRPSANEGAGVLAGIDRLVPGGGALHERVNRLRRQNAVPAAQLEPALVAAVASCRDRVTRWMSLPSGERVSVSRETGVDAEARGTWAGEMHTVLRLDERATPDVAHLVWLAAHESYAGHHLQHVLAASVSASGIPLVERQLHPAFGPHLLYAEGTAEAGASLLLEGTAFQEMCAAVCRSLGLPAIDVERLVAIHRAVRSLDLAIAQVAEAYLDGAMTQEAATTRLAAEGLVTDAAAFLGVIERQRTRVLTYPMGRRLVSEALGVGSPKERWGRLLRHRRVARASGGRSPLKKRAGS